MCRIQKYSDVLWSQILFPFFSWTKSSDNIWLKGTCVLLFFFLSKIYCPQGDQRFRFLLNRFWAASPFSSLLASSPYKSSLQEAEQKTGEKVRLCLKSLEQNGIQQLITKAEILCCHSCSMEAQAAGEQRARLKLLSWSGHSQQAAEKHGLH